jgi:hypothetical protein
LNVKRDNCRETAATQEREREPGEQNRERRNAKSQLNELAFLKMAGAAGLEPATIGFGDRCSTNWNYAPATNEANYTKPGSKVKAFFSLSMRLHK